MPTVRQCELAGVSRATVYAQRAPKPTSEQDLELLRLIGERYARRPFYGSRTMVSSTWWRSSTGTAQEGAELENQQHAGHGILRELFGRGITANMATPKYLTRIRAVITNHLATVFWLLSGMASSFISKNFTGVLKAHGIAISMDGRGRTLDNVPSTSSGQASLSGSGVASNTKRVFERLCQLNGADDRTDGILGVLQ